MEGEQENDSEYLYPAHITALGIPQEPKLVLCYGVYSTSIPTRKLISEDGRHVFADAFIENPLLGPLKDLCIRAMAKATSMQTLTPAMRTNPLLMRLFYDSLSADTPLEECYDITDEIFWKRIALLKSKDKGLELKQGIDWRSLGLSIKFVELVEACGAEYWPPNEMQPLAMKIKDYVKEMHIRKLQSLKDRSFEKYFDSDEELDDSPDLSTVTPTPQPSIASVHSERRSVMHASINVPEPVHEPLSDSEEAEEEEGEGPEVDLMRDERRVQKRKWRDEQRQRRAVREERRERIAEKRVPTPEPSPPPRKSKKKHIPQPKGVFDIAVEPGEEEDEDEKIADKRNLALALKRHHQYNYPPEDCHHIDLSFVRFFDNLTEFTIEFQGPEMKRDFHPRHLNFSYLDMENLARGIIALDQLKVFRLRSSRMDARKLNIIVKSLMHMPNLEIVDFGYDQLEDDCDVALYDLMRKSSSITSLELEYNNFSERAMRGLALALGGYKGKLEYLGLAGNPLGYKALHILVDKILGTEQLSHLNLTSTILSDLSITCCIARELLTQHTQLVNLQMDTVKIPPEGATEMIRALQNNYKILRLDCRGCGLDFENEIDIYVILERNRYIARNPYIGNQDRTEDEVNDYINRVKNPILLRATEVVEKRAACMAARPSIFQKSEISLVEAEEEQEERASEWDDKKRKSSMKSPEEKPKAEVSMVEIKEEPSEIDDMPSPIDFDWNNLTEKQFFKHIFLPGPAERYYYLRRVQEPSQPPKKTVTIG